MKARPTTYNGIRMRSRLEAGFAAWLDWIGFEWEYEPQAFANAGGQYMPDFLLHDVVNTGRDCDTGPVYVEVKPQPCETDRALRDRMAVIWDSEPLAACLLTWPMPGGGSDQVLLSQDEERTPHSAAWLPLRRGWVEKSGVAPLALGFRISDRALPWQEGYWKGPST